MQLLIEVSARTVDPHPENISSLVAAHVILEVLKNTWFVDNTHKMGNRFLHLKLLINNIFL